MICSLTDNSDARLKYDVGLLKSNCIITIKKFRPKILKRQDRNGRDATHIGYIADGLLRVGIEYTKAPILLHKAQLEVIDKVESLEKEIGEPDRKSK